MVGDGERVIVETTGVKEDGTSQRPDKPIGATARYLFRFRTEDWRTVIIPIGNKAANRHTAAMARVVSRRTYAIRRCATARSSCSNASAKLSASSFVNPSVAATVRQADTARSTSPRTSVARLFASPK